jgi:hypothetical protein
MTGSSALSASGSGNAIGFARLDGGLRCLRHLLSRPDAPVSVDTRTRVWPAEAVASEEHEPNGSVDREWLRATTDRDGGFDLWLVPPQEPGRSCWHYLP